ncbi:MAG: crosslink repair DNA glycosylase YcaQ family protein [Pseudomonadota bacterium]
MSDRLDLPRVRRLALAKAGLLRPEVTGLPTVARGRGRRVRERAHAVIDRFGYLQLDTVAITGARTHSIVLASRLEGFQAPVAETLLAPGEPLFEYWGHEACWLPMSLYPHFQFRRDAFRVHPWYGDVLGEHRKVADALLARIESSGPLRSLDLEGERGGNASGWGTGKLASRVMDALWSAGEIAVRSRPNFQRVFDLPERVIPSDVTSTSISLEDSFEHLLHIALTSHGWATTGTLAATWRLRNCRPQLDAALNRLVERGAIMPCGLEVDGKMQSGWIDVADRDLAEQLTKTRPRRDRGVLLSPFDPVLWDRKRVELLFDFEQVLEIYKPAATRRFGYYCLPVLAGDRLIARVDLKAERDNDALNVLALHYESSPTSVMRESVRCALERFRESVGLAGWGARSLSVD